MSSFISITYKCVGSDLKNLFKLYEAFWTNDSNKSRKDDWRYKCSINFASIIASLGFDPKQYELHGEVRSYHLEGSTLVIDSVTGYCEQKDFRKCIEAKFPSIKVYYGEDDPQSASYYTNDSSGDYFPRYFLESYDNTNYFKTIEDAAESVSRLVGSYVAPSADDIYDALDNYYSGNVVCMDDRYSFREYEVRND